MSLYAELFDNSNKKKHDTIQPVFEGQTSNLLACFHATMRTVDRQLTD